MGDPAPSDASAGSARADPLAGTAIDAMQELGSDLSTGLPLVEVEKRRARFGLNRIPDQQPRWILVFLKKFWGVSAWMIELIIVLSAVLHRAAEFWVSAGLLVLNGVIGFFQDRRASRAVEVLKSRLQVNARVLRDRTWSVVLAQELVPGDIIRLRAGDFIPADAKIAEGKLGVDQSTLTGESAESSKPLDAILYSGSIVKRGEATAVVILTGVRTFYGRTTELVESARPRLHLEEVVSKVVRWLFVIVGSLVGMAVGVSLWRGIPLLEILPLALVLLLSAVPVALPVMFTVSMAVGALELARKGVLITRLSAAEDAAGMDILCIDKTGTITMNRLEVSETIPLHGFSEAEVIRLGAWASREANQDPIDLAFLASVRSRGILDADAVQTSYTPFAPETKRTEAVVESRGKLVTVMKGALRTVAQACGADLSELSSLEGRAVEQAKKGYRVLAVGASSRTGRLELAGLVMLSDPPRADSREMIRAVVGLGVSVKMLTGDALPVANEIASIVGLGELRRIGEFHSEMKESSERGSAFVEHCGGLAEVLPEDKYLVVKGLQSAKHVTG
ncbi:MAG TPA: HAD-IC family P-type ATPase, partial [Planctomycetota bacterium]|nr:HAD-IC family P-type ATPase [Planctomycetota bacterium]